VVLLLALAASWSKVAAYEFKPVLGKEVTMGHKKTLMGAAAGLLVLYLGGSLLLSAVGVASAVTLVHSVFRQVPESELPLEYQPPKLTV
jgi:CDP-diglyceride synthetase